MEKPIISDYSNEMYYPSKAIRILTPKQAAAYWLNGIKPVDIYPSRDFTTHEPVLVFVFNKEDTKEVFDLWCKKELK